MKKILILEDDHERHEAFRLKFKDEDVLIVETAKEAIAHLKLEDFDILFLDHDLGGKVYVESGPGTGYEVACFLEENKGLKPKQIIIHSLNPVGAKKMNQAIICLEIIMAHPVHILVDHKPMSVEHLVGLIVICTSIFLIFWMFPAFVFCMGALFPYEHKKKTHNSQGAMIEWYVMCKNEAMDSAFVFSTLGPIGIILVFFYTDKLKRGFIWPWKI